MYKKRWNLFVSTLCSTENEDKPKLAISCSLLPWWAGCFKSFQLFVKLARTWTCYLISKYSRTSTQWSPWKQENGRCREVAVLGRSGCNMTLSFFPWGSMYSMDQQSWTKVPGTLNNYVMWQIISVLQLKFGKSAASLSKMHCPPPRPPPNKCWKSGEIVSQKVPVFNVVWGLGVRLGRWSCIHTWCVCKSAKSVNLPQHYCPWLKFCDLFKKKWGFIYSLNQLFISNCPLSKGYLYLDGWDTL